MSDIRLDDGTINVEGEWLTVEDLTRLIQEKIQSGEMKLTNLAAPLEELNTALENCYTLEIKLVITKDAYERLKAFGGEDDRESVRKSIITFIGGADQPAAAATGAVAPEPVEKLTIKCPHPQCMSPIEITTDERPVIVECPNCGISGKLTAENEWTKLDKV
ncbi:hypothetical protein ACFL0M_12710 [Thermodesulfobacteriota bacterium]